jgi:Rod binding domain-containing protein
MTGRMMAADAPAAVTSLPAATVAKAAKAARDFEAMTLGQLLQPMFDTVDVANTPFGGGSGEEAFKPMMVNEMAKAIAARGGLGLAAPIFAQMLRTQEERSAQAIAGAPGR